MRNRGSASAPVLAQFAGFGLLLVGVALVAWAFRPGDDSLVVYCAHDAEFSDTILHDFERETGIAVAVRYDTEATKSLGLVNLLKAEEQHPRCDVFWNNELLGTVDLKATGVLEPYRGSGFARIPDRYKDPDGCWVGFAARLRVFIVNPARIPPDEAQIAQRLESAPDLSRAAIAKPLFGTTLTHYTLLWHVWGPERLKAWHADTRRRGLREVAGNAATKNLVAEGACDFAFTDTDDYFVAKDAGKPVEMTVARAEGQTICIPNTVAIIRGTKKRAQAQQLVDYLLSAQTELQLARSASRQIPLGSVAEGDLPADVRPLVLWAAQGADLRPLLASRTAVIEWLKSEYLQ
ncbi:MAG: extracellular solute-binding protein [Planctomycetaceae bacterium]|nr:extracellular solute-binding protein [Planctomycetaceae bacterium]